MSIYNPTNEKLGIISRRSFLLTAGKMALLATLGARLYHLQVKEGNVYRDLAEGNRVRLIPVLPRRGSIKDRYGNVVAEGLPRYQLLFSPLKDADKKDSFLQIAKVISMPKEQVDEVLKIIANPKTEYPLVIDNFMSWDNIAKIKVKSRDLKGADVTFFEQRSYPYGPSLCHVVGYTSKVTNFSDENKKTYGEILTHPDLRIGQTGVEYTMQEKLFGAPGYTEVETDAKGRSLKDISYKPAYKGDDIKLTIDVELQEYLHSLLKGKGGLKTEGGSAVLIKVDTGDIMAMTSVPDFDPNWFSAGIKKEQLKDIYSNIDKPLKNKAISLTYPPGSTFKTVTALAGLQEGVFDPYEFVFCPGYYDFGGRTYHCWKKEGHGAVNVHSAIQQSCNVFFYEMGQRIGVDKIAYYAHLLGLGNKTGIELPSEEAGIIPSSEWKMKTLKQPWYKGESLNTAIGQGYVNVTPLQLAVQAARLATGRNVIPRIVIENNQYERSFDFIKGITPSILEIVRSGMVSVVNDVGGTGIRSKIYDPAYAMAGKTGSAQVRGIDKALYGKRSKAIEAKETHSIFVAYAPVHNPKFAMGVIIENGGAGSMTAAPIASQMLLYAQQKYQGKTS